MWPIEERIFFRKFTIPLAKKIKRYNITPNQITFIGFIFAIISGILILQEKYIFLILSAITLYLSYFFDKLDGDLAREKKLTSKYGSWFEGFLDRIGEIFITLCIIFITNEAILGALAISFPLFFCYYNESLSFIPNKKRDKRNIIRFGYTRGRHFLLLILLALLNRLDIFLMIMSMGYVYTIIIFLNRYRKLKKETKI
jgi:phosphatidylglycerophosphate synthase